MNIPSRISLIALLLAAFLSAPLAHAEPPSTSYIFPAGGQRGSRVSVRVGGHYLHESCQFEILGDGVAGPSELVNVPTIWFEGPLIRLPASQRSEDYPKDYAATIAIDENAVLGARYWRVATAQGATAARQFVVGDLPEITEDEIDGEPIAVRVPVPIVVNGRVFPREDVDIWEFAPEPGKPITCAVAASEFGSPLEARIEVRDPDGRMIAEALGATANETVLRFVPDQAGKYRIAIHDIRYDGMQNYVYRLTITDGAWVKRVYPLGGRRGTQIHCQLIQPDVVARLIGAASADVPAHGDPHESLSLPENALAVFDYRFTINGRTTNSVLLAADDFPEHLELEPNDSVAAGVSVEPPVVFNGRVDQPGDVDVWSFALAAEQEVILDVSAARLGSPLDSVLIIRDSSGKEVSRNDDAVAGVPDSQIRFKTPTAGRYFAEVSDRFASRGGKAFAYRLRISAPRPTIRLELTTDAISLERDKQQKFVVHVVRESGCSSPVTLQVEGLPEGVTAADVVVAGDQTRCELNLRADATSRIGVSKVRIIGHWERDGVKSSTVAFLHSNGGSTELQSILLAVAIPTVFKFQGEFQMVYTPCGAISHKRYILERNGFDGPLVVQLADRQMRHLQGVTGPTITVSAGQSEFEYPISLPSWMELGRTSRVVLMATGQMSDGQGGTHPVCFTSIEQNNQMVNLVSASPLKVTLSQSSLKVVPSGSAKLIVHLKRDQASRVPVRIELMLPRHVRDVAVEPLEIGADQDQAQLTLNFGASPGPLNMPVRIRATALRGNDPLTAEARLELVRL